MLDRLAADPRMVTAARVGARLRLDPLLILAAAPTDYHLRLAAARVLAADEERAAHRS